MKGGRTVRLNIGKNGGSSEAHGESVVRVMRKELFESILRKLRLRATIVRGRTVKLLRWVSKSLVKYSQHFYLLNFLLTLIWSKRIEGIDVHNGVLATIYIATLLGDRSMIIKPRCWGGSFFSSGVRGWILAWWTDKDSRTPRYSSLSHFVFFLTSFFFFFGFFCKLVYIYIKKKYICVLLRWFYHLLHPNHPFQGVDQFLIFFFIWLFECFSFSYCLSSLINSKWIAWIEEITCSEIHRKSQSNTIFT